MYLDPFKENYMRQCNENYEALKKFISSKEDGKLNEFYLAYDKIIQMEQKIKEQESKIERYKSFFSKLQSFLPRLSSTSDVIG